MSRLLEVRDLVTRFDTDRGTVHAVNGVSFDLHEGEALGLVGESGSGKSVAVLSMLGLVPTPPGRVSGGTARLRGRDLLALPAEGLRRVRWREVAMIFQDPGSCLNPVMRVGAQIGEVLELHLGLGRAAARERAAEWLERVGIADPDARLDDYPHEFSGGQRQRIMIAMALCCEPAVLIADEPTTALDVTVQAQIVELVRELRRDLGMAILWITHDLALLAGLVDRVAVMYAGRIVEEAPVGELFERPLHPYTQGLLRAMPRAAGSDPHGADGRLLPIEGSPPNLLERIDHCPFAARCPEVVERCREEDPPLQDASPTHRSACWRWEVLDGR
jgi:oligopeptide transport system ATP-binding protein